MAAKAQAIPVRETWHVPWWRMVMLALVATAAILTAILTLQAAGTADPVPANDGVPKSDVRPGGGSSGGYDLGGGVVCHQCL